MQHFPRRCSMNTSQAAGCQRGSAETRRSGASTAPDFKGGGNRFGSPDIPGNHGFPSWASPGKPPRTARQRAARVPPKGGATLGAKPRERDGNGSGKRSRARADGCSRMRTAEPPGTTRATLTNFNPPKHACAHAGVARSDYELHPGTDRAARQRPHPVRSVRWWTNSALSEVHAADLVPLHCPDRSRRAAPLRRAVYAPGRGSSRSSDWRGFRESAFKEDALSGIADELECTRVRQGGRRVIVEPAEATANRTGAGCCPPPPPPTLLRLRRLRRRRSPRRVLGVVPSVARSAQRRSPRRPNRA